ncbi:MAG: hypothetical protein WBE13_02595 [Candidatus Acidiferrum sp.]
MSLRATRRAFYCAVAFLFASVLFASAQSGSSSATGTDGSPFHVVRSIAGAAGHEESDKFVMDDPRSLFSAGKDSKVIIYFEWEGPLGPIISKASGKVRKARSF